MNIIELYLAKLSQFFPIILFMWMYRFTGEWYYAFLTGGIAAVIQIAVFIILKFDLNRFTLAVNLFLCGGAFGMVTNNLLILNTYKKFIQVTLFIWLFLVGVVTTIFSKRGFIDVDAPRKIVVLNSMYLLSATAVAILVAWLFKGNMFIAGVIPFIGLITLSNVLKEKIKGG